MSGTPIRAGGRIAVVLAALAVLATVAGPAVAVPTPADADGASVQTASIESTPDRTTHASASTNTAELDGTNLTDRWTRNLTATSNGSVSLGVVSGLASANGSVFVPGAGIGNNELFAIDGATGTVEWSRMLGGFPEGLSAPATADGTVFVGDYGGQLYALDAANGTTRWTVSAGGGLRGYVGDPLVDSGTVYASSHDSTTGTTVLAAYDAANGTQLWATDIGAGFSLEAPVAVGGRVMIANGSHLIAMDAGSGAIAWVTPADGPGVGVAPLASAPGAGAAIASLQGGAVAAFDAAGGQELWRRDVGTSATAPTAADGRVFVGGDALYALDAASGTTEWTASIGGIATAPAVSDGAVLVTTEPDTGVAALEAVNASTGARLDTALLGLGSQASLAVPPAVSGGSAVVADTSGIVRAFGAVDRTATVRLAPETVSIEANETTTLDVAIDNATLGIDSYGFSVVTNDTSTVRLVNATLLGDPPSGFFSNVTVAADGSTLNVSTGLLNDTDISVLARVTVRGVSNGTAALRLRQAGVGTNENAIPPRSYRLTRRNATVRVGTEPVVTLPPVGDGLAPPLDLDGDGLHEDIDGDERFIIVDVAVFLDRFEGEVIQNNPERFDFNDDGSINVLDVAELLDKL